MIRIKLNNVNGVNPIGFSDYFLVDEIPIMDGFFEIELETENLVSFKNEDRPRVRSVQQIFYPKYKVTIPASQDSRYEMIDKASEVYVVQTGQFDQQVVVTEVSRSFVNQMYVVVIEYYNVSVNDYNRSIAEHLKSSSIKDLSIPLHKLYYSDTDYICTRINPVQSIPEAEVEQTIVNEINVTNKSVLSENYTYIFFCSQADVIALKKGMFKYKVKIDAVTSKEIVSPNDEELQGWDIFKVEIDFIKDKLIYKI
jgi:hypothetical protein